MSDANEQSTNAQEGLSEIAESVENAVAGNSEEAAQAQTTEKTEETAQKAAEAKATLQDPKASKTQKKEAVKQLKKFKLKVDGEEFEEEIDLNNEDDLRERLQMAKVARKRMQEKSAIEKDVLQFIEDLRKNPRKALSDPAIGMDLKKFAAEIIEEEIENSKKSPEQLKHEKLEAELKALKEERENEKKSAQQKELERLTNQAYEQFDIQVSKALETNQIPKNPAVIKRMADYLEIGLNAKKDVTPNDIIPLLKSDLKDDYREILNSMPDDDSLEEFIGKEFVDRIRRKHIAKAKKAASNPAVKAATKTPSTGQKEEKPKEAEAKKTIKQLWGV